MKTGKKGKITAVIMAVVMILSSVPLSGFTGLDFSSWLKTQASAGEKVRHNDDFYDGVIDGLYYNISNNEVTIASCDENKTGEVVIPETIEGYPVTAVGEKAFIWCDEITSIKLPDGLKSIGDLAFNSCSKLTSLFIPDSVTLVSPGAFIFTNIEHFSVGENNNCYSVDEYGVLYNKDKTELVKYPSGNDGTEFTIPESVISIGRCAFYTCPNLTSITIPDSVKYIHDLAFYLCIELPEIEIPGSVISIGGAAFGECFSLEKLIIPDSVTSIGQTLCYACENLTSVKIGNGITEIKERSFSACKKLSEVEIGSSVTYIGKNAFHGCYSLENIEIPSGITFIDECAFNRCNGLTKVKIPDSVKEIGDLAFERCENLKKIFIPDSVTSIGNSAFSWCLDLTIYGYAGSYAETYAEENNIPFKAICRQHSFQTYTTATCLSSGYTCDKCSVCGYKINRKDAPALGHSFKGEVRANFDGTHSFKCERCDTYGDTEKCGGGTATCTQRAVCSTCNTEYGFALGHIFINYISDGNATCTSDGTKTAKCERCTVTDTVTDENSKKPHEDSDGDGFCDFCKASMEQEETGFVGRIRKVIANIIDSIIAIFRRLFG